MKKIFIMLFLSISGYFLVSAFITKGLDKEPVTFNYVLQEFNRADIGFEIQEDINELTTSLEELNSNTTSYSTDLLTTMKSVLLNIYYFGRFALKLIVHTLVASINVIILVLRCIGFATMDYVKLPTGSQGGGGGRGTPSYPIIYKRY